MPALWRFGLRPLLPVSRQQAVHAGEPLQRVHQRSALPSLLPSRRGEVPVLLQRAASFGRASGPAESQSVNDGAPLCDGQLCALTARHNCLGPSFALIQKVPGEVFLKLKLSLERGELCEWAWKTLKYRVCSEPGLRSHKCIVSIVGSLSCICQLLSK